MKNINHTMAMHPNPAIPALILPQSELDREKLVVEFGYVNTYEVATVPNL